MAWLVFQRNRIVRPVSCNVLRSELFHYPRLDCNVVLLEEQLFSQVNDIFVIFSISHMNTYLVEPDRQQGLREA